MESEQFKRILDAIQSGPATFYGEWLQYGALGLCAILMVGGGLIFRWASKANAERARVGSV